MQVITSSTLTLLHDGQFWVAICEHTEGERYGACRVVFGATEPSDTEVLSFVCARWATLEFACTVDDGSLGAASLLAHPNPKRRQREAKKLVQHSGVCTKAHQTSVCRKAKNRTVFAKYFTYASKMKCQIRM